MPFVPTVKLVQSLRDFLAGLKMEEGSDEPLFQQVGFFGANRLVEAIKTTFASEDRVCFIVPGGDNHANQPAGSALMIFSQRTTSVALLIADRSMNTEARLVGDQHTAGILALKDRVLQALCDQPLPLPGLAFVPTQGEPMMIEQNGSASGSGMMGRECWLQWLSTYAGSEKIAVPL